MTDAGSPPIWLTSLVDLATKAVAVVVAVSLVMGISYNIAFFLFSKPEWLFRLTVADNIAATLYALPFTLLILPVVIAWISLMRFLDTRKLSVSRKVGWIAFVGGLIVGVGYTYLIGLLITGLFGSAGWPLMVAFLVLFLLGFFSKAISGQASLVAYAVILMVFALGTSAVLARSAVKATHSVEVEVGDRIGSSVMKGLIIRTLDAGIILSQDGRWTWIPKERVLLIRER